MLNHQSLKALSLPSQFELTPWDFLVRRSPVSASLISLRIDGRLPTTPTVLRFVKALTTNSTLKALHASFGFKKRNITARIVYMLLSATTIREIALTTLLTNSFSALLHKRLALPKFIMDQITFRNARVIFSDLARSGNVDDFVFEIASWPGCDWLRIPTETFEFLTLPAVLGKIASKVNAVKCKRDRLARRRR